MHMCTCTHTLSDSQTVQRHPQTPPDTQEYNGLFQNFKGNTEMSVTNYSLEVAHGFDIRSWCTHFHDVLSFLKLNFWVFAVIQRRCFPDGSVVKNLPAVLEPQEMWVQSLGQEDPLEEEMATHPCILARITPWMEDPGRL